MKHGGQPPGRSSRLEKSNESTSVAELFPCAKALDLDKEMPSAKTNCNRMLLGLAGSANEGHPAAGEVRSKLRIARNSARYRS